jgi:hypothetical protein
LYLPLSRLEICYVEYAVLAEWARSLQGMGMESPAEPSGARRVRVDLVGLAEAFDDASWEVSAFLDLDTGEVIRITAEVRGELEAIYAELPEELVDEARRRVAFAAALEHRKPPGWMHELLVEADAVEGGLAIRFLRVPEAGSRESYGDMQAFIETVSSPWLQERLWAAIHGRGAFRRFKDVLAGALAERERWFTFKDDRLRQRVLAWLADEGIEPLTEVT